MPPKAPESKAAKAAKAMAGGKKKAKVRACVRVCVCARVGFAGVACVCVRSIDARWGFRADVGADVARAKVARGRVLV